MYTFEEYKVFEKVLKYTIAELDAANDIYTRMGYTRKQAYDLLNRLHTYNLEQLDLSSKFSIQDYKILHQAFNNFINAFWDVDYVGSVGKTEAYLDQLFDRLCNHLIPYR